MNYRVRNRILLADRLPTRGCPDYRDQLGVVLAVRGVPLPRCLAVAVSLPAPPEITPGRRAMLITPVWIGRLVMVIVCCARVMRTLFQLVRDPVNPNSWGGSPADT